MCKHCKVNKERANRATDHGREKRVEYNSRYFKKNPDYSLNYRRAHGVQERLPTNHEKFGGNSDWIVRRVRGANKRAREIGSPLRITVDELSALMEKFGWSCFYCGDGDRDVLTLDHLYPLSKGGPNWIENMAPACWNCNMRKSNKYIWEFLPYMNSQTMRDWMDSYEAINNVSRADPSLVFKESWQTKQMALF